MNRTLLSSLALLLVSCGDPRPTVDDLMADPVLLTQTRRQCKSVSPPEPRTCAAAAEAIRKRFMGSGTPYQPRTPSAPASGG